ncbi:glycosyltransferase family protein [Ensifer soli]|uniref:glycosyl transferase n=1 Tax=Ciceribacter sp. sgz301302 TaxID=3342379 RepID=UPI0035BAF3DB
MLTVILETRDSEGEMAQTLSVLVAGAIEGLICDVIILDHGSRDGSARVADAAGCRFLTHWDMRDVVRSARGDWLLLLEPGARPGAGWIGEIAEFVITGASPARFSPSRQHRRPFFERMARRVDALEQGCLISKRQALTIARSGLSLKDMAASVRTARLSTELVPAWVTTRSIGAR